VSWPVIGALVAVLIGAGLNVLSMTPPHHRISEVFFATSALLLWTKFCFWAVTSNATWKERLLIAFLVFGVSGTALVVGLNWVEGLIPRKTETFELSIEMSYDMNTLGLPLPIQPYTTVTIIRINNREKAEALTVQNSDRVVSYWPKEKMGFPP